MASSSPSTSSPVNRPNLKCTQCIKFLDDEIFNCPFLHFYCKMCTMLQVNCITCLSPINQQPNADLARLLRQQSEESFNATINELSTRVLSPDAPVLPDKTYTKRNHPTCAQPEGATGKPRSAKVAKVAPMEADYSLATETSDDDDESVCTVVTAYEMPLYRHQKAVKLEIGAKVPLSPKNKQSRLPMVQRQVSSASCSTGLQCPVQICRRRFTDAKTAISHLNEAHKNSFIQLNNVRYTRISLNMFTIRRIVKCFGRFFVINCSTVASTVVCQVNVGLVGLPAEAKRFKFSLGGETWCQTCVYPHEKHVAKGLNVPISNIKQVYVHLSK